MNSLIKMSFVLTITLLMSLSLVKPSFAEVNIKDLEGVLNNFVAPQTVNQSNKPFLADNNQVVENVDPQTGTLTIKETDIFLPGKDGLDLPITRIYQSNQAELGTKKVQVNATSSSSIEYTNDWFLIMIFYNVPGNYWYSTSSKFSDPIYAREIGERFKNSNNPNDILFNYYLDRETQTVTQYTTSTLNELGKQNYLRTRFDLGIGWSFAFPSVQIEQNESTKYLFFHDGAGAAYKVNFTDDLSDSNLEKYQGKNVQFIEDNGSYSNGEVNSKYTFNNMNEHKKYYFSEDGRLIGIKDRFGNEIKFNHVMRQIGETSHPVISKIVDSIGRTIDFTYENSINDATFDGEDIVVKVSDPTVSENLSIKYTKGRVSVNYKDPNNLTQESKEPILAAVTDAEGINTEYQYKYDTVKFRYDTKDLSNYANTALVSLVSIINPHSKDNYEYEPVNRNLGPTGAFTAYRVKQRYSQERRYNYENNSNQSYFTGDLNHVNYYYEGDYTGYPTHNVEETVPDSYTFSFESRTSNGIRNKVISNGKKQIVSSEIFSQNGESILTKNLEFHPSFNYLPTKIEKIEKKDNTNIRNLFIGYTYNDIGKIETETQPLTAEQFSDDTIKSRHTTTYKYDANFKFPEKKIWYQSNEVQLSESYLYDNLGRIKVSTNANSEVTEYNYSQAPEGNVVEVTRKLENGKIAKSKIIFGEETRRAYPTNILTSYTDNDGNIKNVSATKSYNLLLGLVSTETDSKGNTFKYKYDKLGRLMSKDHPNFDMVGGNPSYEAKEIYEYSTGTTNDKFNVNNKYLLTNKIYSYTLITDKSDNTSRKYNEREQYFNSSGNLIMSSLWDYWEGYWIDEYQYNYDSFMRPIFQVDAEGNSQTYSYDSWGNRSEWTDPLGNIYKIEYDMTSQKTTSFFLSKSNIEPYQQSKDNNFKENVLETYIDNLGRVSSREAYPNWPDRSDAITESYKYDISGNMVMYIDPMGNKKQYSYDSLNRIAHITDPINTIDYSYTTLGNLKTITQKDDKDSWTVTKDYDELGRTTKSIDAASLTDFYKIDSTGLVEESRDPNQVILKNTYDQWSRLTSVKGNSTEFKHYFTSTPFGVEGIEMYDNSLPDAIRLVLYGYNANGQINSIGNYHEDYGNYLLTLNYSYYDKIGRITGIEPALGSYTKYKYEASMLKKIQTNGSNVEDSSENSNIVYDYFPDGKIKSVTFPKLNDGTFLKSEYSYDKINRLRNVTNLKGTQKISNYAYQYDKNGNIKAITDDFGTTIYNYDQLNRLSEVIKPNGEKEYYTYDVRGNRKTLKDDNNILNNSKVEYRYNEYNQLLESIDQYGNKTIFQYDPSGLRLRKKLHDGQVTNYNYSTEGKLILETNVSNSPKAEYVWGHNKVLVKKDRTNNNDYYYLYNGHGDVVQIVDKNGNVVNNYAYDEWGNILNQSEGVSNSFKYAGEVFDPETGLYYLKSRYYDPSTGRFINKDTYEGDITNPLSLNLYTYVHNNPLSNVDPTGHWCTSVDGLWSHAGGCDDGTDGSKGLRYWGEGYSDDSLHNGEREFRNGKPYGDVLYFDHLLTQDSVREDEQTGAIIDSLGGAGGIVKGAVKGAFKGVIKNAVKECNCFTRGTKVSTDEGEKDIEDIEVGDMVLSKDETTGELAYKEVTATFNHETDEIYQIHVGDQVIESTYNHPFWVEGKGWTYVKDLKVGDLLVQSNGNTLKIDSIELLHKQVTVYNMTVDEFHTYFVSDLGIWVHNTGPCINITAGKNFKSHFLDHKKILENALGTKYSKLKEDGPRFLADIGKMIDDGTVKFVGQGTLNKNSEVYNIFRGNGMTVVTKPNGEWVTLLDSGKGMDLNILFK